MIKVPDVGRFVVGLALVAGTMCAPVRADDCVTGAPTPMFSAARRDIPAHAFQRKSAHEAIERFRLGPDVQVRVEHGGCEYVVAKFRFESPGLFANSHADGLAYEQAAALLGRLKALRPERDFDFDLGLAGKTLLQAARRKRPPGLGEELHVRGDGVAPLEAVLQVEAAGRRGASGYVEVSLFRGPL